MNSTALSVDRHECNVRDEGKQCASGDRRIVNRQADRPFNGGINKDKWIICISVTYLISTACRRQPTSILAAMCGSLHLTETPGRHKRFLCCNNCVRSFTGCYPPAPPAGMALSHGRTPPQCPELLEWQHEENRVLACWCCFVPTAMVHLRSEQALPLAGGG